METPTHNRNKNPEMIPKQQLRRRRSQVRKTHTPQEMERLQTLNKQSRNTSVRSGTAQEQE
mgnify:CR=1 FL=1